MRQRVRELLNHSRSSTSRLVPKPGTWAHELAPHERYNTSRTLLRLNDRLPVIEKRDFENGSLEFTATWHKWVYAYARKLPSQPELVYVQDESDAWLTFEAMQQRFEEGHVLNIVTRRMKSNPAAERSFRRRLPPPTPRLAKPDA